MYRVALGSIADLSDAVQCENWLAPELYISAPCGKRRAAWLAGRVLLAKCLQQQPLAALMLGVNGKPQFVSSQLPKFNLSHSGDDIALAVAEHDDIGCDLEVIRPRPRWSAIAQHYFSAQEYQWLCQQPTAAQLVAFWRLWTAREAVLKQQGGSVWQMQQIALDPVTLNVPGVFIHYMLWQQRLSFAVCSREQLPVVFFDASSVF